MSLAPLRKARLWDSMARKVITLGGFSILLCLALIMGFLILETLPLLKSGSYDLIGPIAAPGKSSPTVYVGSDPNGQQAYWLDRSGHLNVGNLTSQGVAEIHTRISLNPATDSVGKGEAPVPLMEVRPIQQDLFLLVWGDGTLTCERLHFKRPGSDEVMDPSFQRERQFELATDLAWPDHHNWGVGGWFEDALTAAFPLVEGRILLGRWPLSARQGPNELPLHRPPPLKPERAEGHLAVHHLNRHGEVTALAVSRNGARLYVGSGTGWLSVWDLEDLNAPRLLTEEQVIAGGDAIQALDLIFGDLSVMIGDASGGISVWGYVPQRRGGLVNLHSFDSFGEPVARMTAFPSTKLFLAQSDRGGMRLFHLTSAKTLFEMNAPATLTELFAGADGHSLQAMDEQGSFWFWRFSLDHPEITFRTLWRSVLYEGYPESDFVWQSSSAANDFQPKMSLVPLLFGTLKGASYGLLFALPIAVLTALYVSHLMHPKWRQFIRPAIELMAALPTVVIGFFASVWLAPLVADHLIGMGLVVLVLPWLIGLGILLLLRSKRGVTGREFLWGIPLFGISTWLAFALGTQVERIFFDSEFKLWLFEHFRMIPDQRNSVLVAFALGFATIPLVFSITEEALRNVPRSLTAAAFALGSSRWQTLRYVVLPQAFPGILAAALIGFGRAIGETMIFLIVSGNTPILSASIFNGMRALTANIVIEIPEAPVGSSLYRVLFLSASLLLAITFLVNTLAEVVRARLYKRYEL
ncbi:ABC transporter permease subunit [Sulfidibacter corallicola]|uniref:ABC transporter permease subunit n=1 Tax=Sulfidibacter corallicola TaxID=2818388 RepID=A0A8A4U3C7_SULCO|nr:ABC transporter permease subunit [Sulfidibacter corallicola]QTD53245.1 ABC transporter permease subunit [Sulfidibacter corallicola]